MDTVKTICLTCMCIHLNNAVVFEDMSTVNRYGVTSKFCFWRFRTFYISYIDRSSIIRHLHWFSSTFNAWWFWFWNILIPIKIGAENEIRGDTTIANKCTGERNCLFPFLMEEKRSRTRYFISYQKKEFIYIKHM